MTFCRQGFDCGFESDDEEELVEHETSEHPFRWVMVGRKPYGRIGYKNIFKRIDVREEAK